jgi:hypothetical protein
VGISKDERPYGRTTLASQLPPFGVAGAVGDVLAGTPGVCTSLRKKSLNQLSIIVSIF